MTPVDKRKNKLRSYSYEFEWKHSNTLSTIVSFKVSTPRSKEFVSHLVNGIVVFGMLSDEPIVRLGTIPLQHITAITAEIQRERLRLLVARESASRITKTKAVSMSQIIEHERMSLKAKEYVE